jgi:hypothetical protein
MLDTPLGASRPERPPTCNMAKQPGESGTALQGTEAAHGILHCCVELLATS